MGWTGQVATCYKNGKIDKKAECDKIFENVVKSSIRGNVYYAAIKHKDVIYGMVCLCSVQKEWIHIKEISEDMGPFYYDCPIGILKLLSKTDNGNALEWRQKCMEKRKTKCIH